MNIELLNNEYVDLLFRANVIFKAKCSIITRIKQLQQAWTVFLSLFVCTRQYKVSIKFNSEWKSSFPIARCHCQLVGIDRVSSDCKCVKYDNPLVSKLTRYINTKLGDYDLRLFQLARKWITSNQMSRVSIPSTRDYIELNNCMVSWCRFNRIVFNKEAVWSRYLIVFSISLNTEEFTNISKVLVYGKIAGYMFCFES